MNNDANQLPTDKLLPTGLDEHTAAIKRHTCHGCGHPVVPSADGWYACDCGRRANIFNKPMINYEIDTGPAVLGNDRP